MACLALKTFLPKHHREQQNKTPSKEGKSLILLIQFIASLPPVHAQVLQRHTFASFLGVKLQVVQADASPALNNMEGLTIKGQEDEFRARNHPQTLH